MLSVAAGAESSGGSAGVGDDVTGPGFSGAAEVGESRICTPAVVAGAVVIGAAVEELGGSVSTDSVSPVSALSLPPPAPPTATTLNAGPFVPGFKTSVAETASSGGCLHL